MLICVLICDFHFCFITTVVLLATEINRECCYVKGQYNAEEFHIK